MDHAGLHRKRHHRGRGGGERAPPCCLDSVGVSAKAAEPCTDDTLRILSIFDLASLLFHNGVAFLLVFHIFPQVSMPHQWLEGNLPVSAKCVVCDKNCGSVRRLQDWRCLWCKTIVSATPILARVCVFVRIKEDTEQSVRLQKCPRATH